MIGSIKKLLNKLGFKHRNYEPPAKPRWKVEQLEGGNFLYYQYKPSDCPDNVWYITTGNSLHSGLYKEVHVRERYQSLTLFKGYVSFK